MSALVFVAGNVSVATYEAITAARSLYQGEDSDAAGAVDLAVRAEPAAEELAGLRDHGVRDVIVIPAATFYGFGQAISLVVQERGHRGVLAPSSFGNKEVAAYVAQALDVGLLVDVAGLAEVQGRITGTKRAFAGTWQTSVAVGDGPFVVTLRANSVVAETAQTAGTAAIVPYDAPLTESTITITSRRPISDGPTRPPLSEASIVVAGGRGTLGDFSSLEELADLLDAAVGTTRDAVEEEWITHDLQIGQTGVTIAPRLYIGAGISGAPHHVGGMQSSGTIVAINTDEEAPLVAMSDIAVIGDLHEVVPALIAELRRRKENDNKAN